MTERHSAHAEEQQPAGPGLDERGQALKALLTQLLAPLQAQVEESLDEVVVKVKPQDVPQVCQICKEDPQLDLDYLRCLSVVDYIEHLRVVYHLYSLDKRHKCVIQADLPADDPVVPSIVSVYPGANWHEREGAELFGVTFEGHPDMKPLLLYEGFEGHPGLKSFPFHEYEEW